MQKKRGKKLNITILRRTSQVFFLLFILYGGLLGINKLAPDKSELTTEEEALAGEVNENLIKDPRLNLYLPIRSCKNTNKEIGVFQGCVMFMFSEVLTYRTFVAFAIPILFVMGLIFIFGRTWCGWACPVGFFQEVLDWVRGKLRIGYIRLPRRINKLLRKVRWYWLSIILIVSFAVALPVFGTIRKDLYNINCLTCPTRYLLDIFPMFHTTYMTFNTPFYIISSAILIMFLGVFGMSFFIRRFWCRLCPNGAFLAMWNKGGMITKQKDMQKCTKCGICYRICPMDNEDVYTVRNRKVVNSKNCVMCFECVDKCPEDDCLQVKVAGKTILRSRYK
jgi:ferredoxin-type protein NapH